MSEWKETIIENIADVKTGPYGSALLNAQYVRGGTPVITVEHIKDFRICQLDYPSVSEEDKARLASYTLEEGDIVFSRVGSVDLSAIAKKENVGWLFSSRMLRVRPNRKKIDPFFLSYYLRLHEVRNYIKKISVGSTMPSINTEILKSIPVYHFDVEEQKEIAKTLSNLDNKITLLRQQNQTLEELAQTLFKRWFVEFEFPDENGRPYKSSGGKMVESELGEIPEGWRVGQYGDIVNISSGKGLKKDDFIENGSFEVLGANGRLGFSDEYLINEEAIITGRVGTLGTVFLVREPVWLSDNVLISQPREKCLLYFAYFILRRFNFNSLNRGSTQPLITQGDLKLVDILVPDISYLNNFHDVSEKLFIKIFSNEKEIQTLTQLRDTLLPKLMSGEVRVKSV